jgi:NADP-dependent aldehyde dehydrogenase
MTPILDSVLSAASSARGPLAASSPCRRAEWLRAAADALEARRVPLVDLAMRETHLPTARLDGELTRTAFQLRLLADRAARGDYLDVRIDHADPAWPMGARPDIRRMKVPLGVVLVFAASNFPFAFSVAGGDTASALAAGCPVVVKANPGHRELSRAVAAAVSEALTAAGAPGGMFGMIESDEDGQAAVTDPRVAAVGFTGSTRVGRMLFDLASARPEPIPFYGELGSTNPVVVTPAAAAERPAEIAEGFVGSFTLGAGQFCTKPGWLLVPAGSALPAEAARLVARAPAQPMLNGRIKDGFAAAVSDLARTDGFEVLAGSVPSAGPDLEARPVLLTAPIASLLADPGLIEAECFGPAATVVTYQDIDEPAALARRLPGQLTASVQAAGADPDAAALVEALAGHAGRVLWNQWPTGVTVSDAQQHGGPYPATTVATSTSVGTAAVERWLRPVAYQNAPADVLPPALRNDNPWQVPRLVDGQRDPGKLSRTDPADSAGRTRRSQAPQGLVGEAGHVLVPLGDAAQLAGVDDILDPRERPVARPQPHFPQDGVRGSGPVGAHHLGRRGQAGGLVRAQGGGRVRDAGEGVAQGARVEDRLPRAVRAAGHHGMRRVAEQGQPPVGPVLQRVLVHHRVLQDFTRGPDHGGNVQPVETPVLERADEVAELAAAVPVPVRVPGRLELGHPVDELVSRAVHVVPDGVDHHLAGGEPAGPGHGRAGQERGMDDRAAPHVHPGIDRRSLVRVKLLAQPRVDAVARDDDVRARRRQRQVRRRGAEGQGRAAGVLGHPGAGVIEAQAPGPEPVEHRGQQDGLQVAAVDRELRVLVAGEPAGRLGVDELAEAVEEGRFAGGDTSRRQLLLEAEPGEDLRRVREDVDADAYGSYPGGGFVDFAVDAGVVQLEGKRQPADACSDDRDFHHRQDDRRGMRPPAGGR